MKDEKTARVTWKGENLNFAAEVGSGYQLDLSSQSGPENGGSPMELLLAGVAGCTAMDVVHVLRKKRQPFTGVEVAITGVRAQDYPQVYTDLMLTYIVSGEGVTPKAVEQAIALSQETYCSASIMFKQAGVNIHTQYEIKA